MRILLVVIVLVVCFAVPLGAKLYASILTSPGNKPTTLTIRRRVMPTVLYPVVVCMECPLKCRAVISDELMQSILIERPKALCQRPEEFEPKFIPKSWVETLNPGMLMDE